MKKISHESTPCWYELGWDEDNSSIILRIHKDFIKEYPKVPDDIQTVEDFTREFKLETFLGDFDGDIGFGGILKRKGGSGEFVEFSMALPTLKKENGRCNFCSGSGESQFLMDAKCVYCEGSGKQYYIDWKGAFSISASFNVIFSLLERFHFDEKETKCSLPQLMVISLSTRNGIAGGSIWGTFSIDLAKWMSTFNPLHTMEEMVNAMESTCEVIFAHKPDQHERFSASIDSEDGWLNVSCSGNACGLDPSNGRIKKGSEYDFSPHNVETPIQQITLLAGLAALHDKARSEM